MISINSAKSGDICGALCEKLTLCGAGSNGSSNIALDQTKTKVYNENVTSPNITHGNIQESEVPKAIIQNQLNNHIRGCN